MRKLKINSLKIGAFLELMKERPSRFKNAIIKPIPKEYPINALAKTLHPAFQAVKITAVEEHGLDCKTFTLSPDRDKKTSQLAYFASGQYITVFLKINGLKITRAYSLSSAPYESLGETGYYQITVKSAKDGLASNYILDNWNVGTEVQISAPEGNFDYVGLRDAPTVVGIAGGSGITPFLSFAKSIVHGDEDFNLILLYGSRDSNSILFKKEFDELQQQSSKIKVVHVLSNEEKEGFEHGFLTAELIKKYAPETLFSVFLCGPQAMYNFMDNELKKLNLEKKYIRHEMFGEIHSAKTQEGYPGNAPAEVKITVTICDETRTVTGSSDDTILQILEKNGIAVPNRCRSGECGWCHSLVKSGNYWMPAKLDFRRKADLKYNFIHPCCTFPLSDMELDVPPAK